MVRLDWFGQKIAGNAVWTFLKFKECAYDQMVQHLNTNGGQFVHLHD